MSRVAGFQSFVILAGMRTGSNLLEAALGTLPGVICHGEAFNPTLIGHPGQEAILGITRAARDADPDLLLGRLCAAPGLNGWRYFHDHDPRVLAPMLADRRCAKIVLTRNPAESYVSLKIARATGQWQLGDLRNRRAAQAVFDAEEFEEHLAEVQAFRALLRHRLQTSGQTAFTIDYGELRDLAVLNGLASWLGVTARIEHLPARLVPQNPGSLAEKVANPAQMAAALGPGDRFDLARGTDFEPPRGPNLRGWIGCGQEGAAGVLYAPLRPVPETALRHCLAPFGPRVSGFTRQGLSDWRANHPGHRSFTVLRHPLLRAYLALSEVLIRPRFAEMRQVLRSSYRLPLPPDGTQDGMGEALEAFLIWLKANLAGQTSLPAAPLWASQSAALRGLLAVTPLDLLIREERLAGDLAFLAASAGVQAEALPRLAPDADRSAERLARIYHPGMEKAAREAFAHDFQNFGFKDWRQ